jgi:hypothetical protein
MELNDVLIIENDGGIANRVQEEFRLHNINTTHVTDDKQVKQEILKKHYQMAILDWYLDDDSSDLAKLCLEKIRQSYFLPVVIWTEEIDIFRAEAEEVYRFFPQAMIYSCSKDDIKYDNLFGELEKWHSTPPFTFAEDLRQCIALSTENTLYTLAEYSLDDLTSGLKTLIASDQSPQVDIEHTIEVLSKLIERGIFKDTVFIKRLEETIKRLSLVEAHGKKKPKNYISSIQDLYMFYEPPENDLIIRTGDLVEVDVSPDGEPNLRQAIVITPACDLANPRKTIFIRLALIENVLDKDKDTDSVWKYTYKEKQFRVCFHQLIVLKNETLNKNENLKVVMSYGHTYITLDNKPIRKFLRLRRLGEPYCSDLLHNFISHAGRIGQPDFSARTLIIE